MAIEDTITRFIHFAYEFAIAMRSSLYKLRNAGIAVLSTILISACVTFGQMETGLSALMGKPESEAFAVLGYPSFKQEFGNDLVYTWHVDSSGTAFVPQVSTMVGSVGRIPIQSQSTSLQAVPVNYSCTIKMVASGSGIFKSWEYNGNLGGCANLIKRLNKYSSVDQAPIKATEKARLAEGREQLAKLNSMEEEICQNEEFASVFAKSPCKAEDLTFEHLTENTKITELQKASMLKLRKAIEVNLKFRLTLFRTYGGPKGNRGMDYMESTVIPNTEKNLLDLYNSKITWGEYNQQRKAIMTAANAEDKRLN